MITDLIFKLMVVKKDLSTDQRKTIINVLKERFGRNMNRHEGMEWNKIQSKLEADTGNLWTLNEMEKTGGEPDVVGYDKNKGKYIFFDCSKESPEGRRNICYDSEALESRKTFKPDDNAIDMASEMGADLLNEEQYRYLQSLGDFDTKTSSWLKTPSDIRKLGGAIFGDKRYGKAFVYHNGAQSYYKVRGFRCALRI
jgi:hypothetical protein